MAPINPASQAIKRAATFEETQFLLVAALSSKWSDVADYLNIEDAPAAQAKIYDIRSALFTPLSKVERKAMKKVEASRNNSVEVGTSSTQSTTMPIQSMKLEEMSEHELQDRLDKIDGEAEQITKELEVRKEAYLLEEKLKEEEQRLKAKKAEILAMIKREENEIQKQRDAIRELAVENARFKRVRVSDEDESVSLSAAGE